MCVKYSLLCRLGKCPLETSQCHILCKSSIPNTRVVRSFRKKRTLTMSTKVNSRTRDSDLLLQRKWVLMKAYSLRGLTQQSRIRCVRSKGTDVTKTHGVLAA